MCGMCTHEGEVAPIRVVYSPVTKVKTRSIVKIDAIGW